ncbi:MAG TPA: DNA polymerase III subunit alpha [Spirochaetota bacterium]|nr:DNA polymerase III subunit alpha [Spirochaetota bacterium]HPR46394.1 DNA polymerase III subunit alpha [Spirochaetota bacterium]
MEFIHLHNHSDYSILDGAITIDSLIKKAVEMGMPAVALTDHGNMFGAIEFYQKAVKAGITPIIGEEFYIAPGSRFDKTSSRNNGEDTSYHLLVIAKNEEGYRNLMKLSSIGYIEGFYYKPRIDMEVLEKYSSGLICSSACLAGQIPQSILRGRMDEARETAGRFAEIFGRDHFYLELQDHGIPEQKTVNTELIKISSELNIPLIATNDAHYVNRDDAFSHEVLLCVQTGKTMTDPARMRFHSNEFYLKSADEMYRLFAEYPDALYNTYKIYEMVDLSLTLGRPILPNFEVPQGYDLDSFLTRLVKEGSEKIYGRPVPEAVTKRIKYELSVIASMHFSGYFLIVWDFINHAKKMNIPVGPGRGSAAGSMVSYCLGITNLDPIRYNLLFERFLNPDRNEMPDMDLDFCADRREEVIEYVRNKYGDDHVSQIITFNKMKAKAVIKDVARAMDIPFSRANEISKLIEEDKLSDSLKKSKEFRDLYKDDEGKQLVDISLRLEGLCRSAGKHAAGVVISKGPLTDYVPLYRDKDGSISSQYEKNTLEQAGLVKMDFLGLKNLSIIDRCLKLIRENRGETVDITTIPLDDAETFRLLQRADTKGVFQLESSGMQNLLRRLGPTEFEDIIAIVALYRPGPLKSGMADDFIDRKRNPLLVKYPHPSLEPVLKDTLGVVVYQEQVMLISQVIAGFTLPEADKLRKAMGKKNMDIINALEEKFLAGAEKNKIDRKLAVSLYDMIKKFGEYGFNKSHSAAYALVTYQTAYLKAHYTIEYMTALMSAQPDRQDDIIQYTNDSRTYGISVLPPSVNSSHFDFTIEGKSIRFGLGAVKGLGERAIETIISARERCGGFSNLRDFFEHVDSGVVNKGVLESLIKAGAFERLHPNRAQLFASIELLLDSSRRLQEDRASGQGDLFGSGADGPRSTSIDLVPCEKWPDNVKLAYEKEVLGLYVSGHPLARYEKEIGMFSSVSITDLSGSDNGKDISIVGIISNVQVKRAQKSGNPYALGLFEDLSGTLDIMVFGKVLSQFETLIFSGEPVMVTGTVEAEGETAKKIIVRSLKSLKDVRRESIAAIHIKLDPLGVDDTVLDKMKSIFQRHKGECPIYFHVKEEKNEKVIKAHSAFNISPSDGLVKDLSEIVGQESIRYSMGRST